LDFEVADGGGCVEMWDVGLMNRGLNYLRIQDYDEIHR